MESCLGAAQRPTPLQPQLKEYFDQMRKSLPKAYAAVTVRAGDAATSEEAEDDAQAAVSWGEVTRAVPTDQVGGRALGRL